VKRIGMPQTEPRYVPADTLRPPERRNWWIWVSAALAAVAVGLLIWALAMRSDLDRTEKQLESARQELAGAQEQLDSTSQELATTQDDLAAAQQDAEEGDGAGAGAVAAAGALYKQFADRLDATEQDLAATQKELDEAQRAAEQADEEAEAAEQRAAEAGNETEKAQAQAEQATAEAKAAESRAAMAVDCSKAFIGALGGLFEGDDVEAQAKVVREQLDGIIADCQAQLAE